MDGTQKPRGRGGVKFSVAVAAIILAYLFALNGRYSSIGENGALFDKWTRTLLVLDDNGDYIKLTDK